MAPRGTRLASEEKASTGTTIPSASHARPALLKQPESGGVLEDSNRAFDSQLVGDVEVHGRRPHGQSFAFNSEEGPSATRQD